MLPIYKATITDINDGIINVSLVDEPAVEVDFITLGKQDELQTFKSVNEEKHLLTGVIMTANKLIYRRNGDYEYYIKYEPETIRIMAEKLLSDMAHENIDIDHKQELLDKGKVLLQELWIKTPDKPGPFENIEDGSLLATYHVYDEEIWDMCKSDRFNGFSLCGYFGTEQELQVEKYKTQHKTMFEKLKEIIKNALIEFAAVKTDKGVLYTESEDLQEGMGVTNEEGQSVEDGDYALEDGTLVTIVNSVIEKIEKPESEETTEETTEETVEETVEEETEVTEETTEEETVEEVVEEKPADDVNKTIDELKAEIDVLKETVSNIQSNIESIMEKINAPMVEPIVEQYETITKINDKWSKIGSALKK